jgi:hypothetical protein
LAVAVSYLVFGIMIALALALAMRPGAIRTRRGAFARVILDATIIVVAANAEYPWYGKFAIFFGLMFLVHGILVPSVRLYRERKANGIYE